MLPLKSSSRLQLGLDAAAAFEAAGVEAFGIPPANLDVSIDILRGSLTATTGGMALANLEVFINMLRGSLAATRGAPWLGAKGKEEVATATDCIAFIMIDRE